MLADLAYLSIGAVYFLTFIGMATYVQPAEKHWRDRWGDMKLPEKALIATHYASFALVVIFSIASLLERL